MVDPVDNPVAPRISRVDPFLMSILRRRFEAIIREMTSTLFRSGRSGVINTAMDFSCNVTDAKFQSISVALGLPVHVGAIDLIPRAVDRLHGPTLKPGDCFANNSGYLGNTHCADFTLCVPVFFEGTIVCYAIARAHFADMGFPKPTTYGPDSIDMYAEGLMLPCVRIQQDYRDVEPVVAICKANIRSPDQFYGDYLACLAAVRIGEKRLTELCRKYGRPTITDFIDDFQDYAERMAASAIRKLPRGTVAKTVLYDSELPAYPDGIPVCATLTVDPDEARIEFDLTANIDNVPLGINMTESTTLACCRMGALNVLGPDIPRCTGAFRRIDVKLRDGALVGRPRPPAATSSATTNVCNLFASHVHALFAEIGHGLGSAYGSIGLPGSSPVVSGTDSHRSGLPFVNQILMGHWGGPAVGGNDGWLTYGSGSSQGMLWQSSVEIVEKQQPIVVDRLAIRVDSGGAGQWQGGPGSDVIFSVRKDAVRFSINAAAHRHPPPGVAGGSAGAPTRIHKIGADGGAVELRNTIDVTLNPGEKLHSLSCGGGGYGAPRRRDPAVVREQLREGWISAEFASANYGVTDA